MSSARRVVPGSGMSQAVAWGNLVCVAGQVAQRAGGAAVAEQTKDIRARIEELLAEAGSDKTKLLSATIWLTDIATFDEMNGIWDAWVAPGAAPARACVEAKIASPPYNVESAGVAASCRPCRAGLPPEVGAARAEPDQAEERGGGDTGERTVDTRG